MVLRSWGQTVLLGVLSAFWLIMMAICMIAISALSLGDGRRDRAFTFHHHGD